MRITQEKLNKVNTLRTISGQMYILRFFLLFQAFIGSIKFPRSRQLQVLTKTCPTTLRPSSRHTYGILLFHAKNTRIYIHSLDAAGSGTRPPCTVRIASAIVMCAHCNLLISIPMSITTYHWSSYSAIYDQLIIARGNVQ